MRKKKDCKNWDECSGIANRNGIEFTCDGCDGIPLAKSAGLKQGQTLEAPKTKWCKGMLCRKIAIGGVDKPMGDFGKNSSTKDKLQHYCKKCATEMVRLSKKKAPKETVPEKVAVKDPLVEKMMERLRHHQEEIHKIIDAFALIEEITGESFLLPISLGNTDARNISTQS